MALKRFLKRAVKKAAVKAVKKQTAKSVIQKAATAKKKKILSNAAKVKEANAAKKVAKVKAGSTSLTANNAKKKKSTVTNRSGSGKNLASSGKSTKAKLQGGKLKTTKVKSPSTLKSSKLRTSTANKRAVAAAQRRKRAAALRESKGSSKTVKSGGVSTTTGTKLPKARKPKSTKTTSLTTKQKQRALLTRDRDIGAKAAAAKTPKSTAKTVRQASGPARIAPDLKNSTDPSKSQRAGRVSGKKGPTPKSTNAPQQRSGRVVRNARADARQAVDNFEVKARKTISDRVKKAAANGATGTEQRNLKRKLERQMNAGKRRVKSAAEYKSNSSQTGNKNNTNPSVSNQSGVAGRDWRNRMTDSKVRKMSENMTKQTSGKKVRTNGEAMQSPKGRGTKSVPARAGRPVPNQGSFKAKGQGNNNTASSSKLKKASNVKQEKPKTITNKAGNKEAKISPKTQPNVRRVTARQDAKYQGAGIDPAKRYPSRQVNDPVNRAGSNVQGPKQRTINATTPNPEQHKRFNGR